VVGARIRRARESTARTSLLPVNGLAGRVNAQTRRLAGSTEVTGYTELVEHVRDGARRDLADRAARPGPKKR
jgi:hypothetical protein